jgi:hypothetical protein
MKLKNINYKILNLGNPWLRRKKLTNTKRKKYTFKILQSEYKILSNYKCYNKVDSLNKDSLNTVLQNDSISSLVNDTNSRKNSIISDSLSKEIEIGEVKK